MTRQQTQQNKAGRPTKRDNALIEKEIVRLLRNGNTRKTAAEVVGINPSTFWRWCQMSARFRNAVTRAEAEAVSLYVNALTTKAVEGDTKAIIFYLTHRHGDDWKPPKERKELTGEDGGPVGVKVFTDPIVNEV